MSKIKVIKAPLNSVINQTEVILFMKYELHVYDKSGYWQRVTEIVKTYMPWYIRMNLNEKQGWREKWILIYFLVVIAAIGFLKIPIALIPIFSNTSIFS